MSPTQPDFLSRLLNNLSLARRRSERLPRTRLNLETLEDRLAPAVAVFREGLDVGFGAYAGTQDVRLVENAADTNFGQDTLIWTDFASSSPSNTSQVLMRFDNIFGDAAVGQIPPNAVITSAQLLISTEGSSNSQGDGGSFHRMLVDWDESVTWNTASPNFPGAGAIPGFDATETFESQAGFPTLAPNIPVGRAAYDVTQDLRAWLNDASNVQSSGTPTLTFADANPDTITRDGGSWLSDGFAVGDRIRVIGTTNNNGTYVIAGVTATTITLDGNNTLTSEADVSGATVFEVTNRGWLMNPWENGTDGWGFQSSESTIPGSRPELRVEYFIPNPPNTDTVSFGSPVVAGLQEASPNSTGPGGTIVLGAGTTQQTLVRFDNLFVSQGGSIPDGANILGARLRATTQGDSFNFFFGSPEDPRAGSGAELFRLLQPFTAGSTWNSFTDGVQADGTEAVVSPDDSVGFNRGAGMIGSQQTVFFDVADTVRAWAEGETNHGFALLPFSNGTDDWQFLTSSLQLEVTYSTDIDPARFIVSSTGTAVNESGTPTVTVGVKLDRAPQANVTIPIASTNTAEGTVSVTELTFTPLDFATEQFFTVTGVDDSIVDGNRPFEVTFGPASSTDQNYNLRTADSLVITNTDDDTSGLAVLTFQQNVNNGFGVYTDVVDTNLSLNDPNIPQNNDTRLLIDAPSADSGLTEQALVRFNNIIGGAAGQLPAGSEVISATLTMTTTGGAGNGDGGSVHRILQDWAPDATYNSFGGGIQADDVEAASTFNAQAGSSLLNNDPADFQVVNMDVTRDVQAWADGASNFGWSILPWANGTNAWIAFSSEDAEPENRPTLTIEYVIPQPTTAVLEFRDGQDGYTGTADTQLLEGDATTPRGSDNGILVDFDPGSINGHGLVRFDDIIGNAANQIPVGSTVFSAELVLHTFNTGDGGTFHRMVSAWDEATATWDSFSGGIQADGSEAAVAFNSQAGNDTGSPNVPTQSGSYDVTADIQAWANGETNNGWAFLPYQDRTDGWEFYTSDFADLGARPLLRVTLSNRPPQADDDRFSVAQDSGANVLDVLNGDFDPDSDTFLITNVSTPTSNGGTVVIIGGGTGLTYEPASGFFGVDSFTYTIEDSNGSTATATVTVDVNATGNNAPVAVDDNYPVGGPAGTALEDTPFVVNAANGLITNDTDTDVTDVLTVNAFTQPTNGTVTVNPDGSFTYTPAQNFNGVDSFVYTLVDGRGGIDTAIVTITVDPVNDAPDAIDDDFFLPGSAAVNLDVLANDVDIDLDVLSITEINGAAAMVGTPVDVGDATVTLEADNTLTFLPDVGFSGVNTFTYTAFDGSASDTATVTVDNSAPQGLYGAGVDQTATDEDTPVTIAVLANDSRYVVEAANFSVVQFDPNNNNTSVDWSTDQGTPNFFIRGGNRGDLDVQIGLDGSIDDTTEGVMITSVREDGRDNSAGGSVPGLIYAVTSAETGGSGYFLPVESAIGSAGTPGSEVNLNPAAAYFAYGDNWVAGQWNGTSFGSQSAGVNLGTEFIVNADGTYNVDLTGQGVSSQTDGILLAVSNENNEEYAQVRPNADGTWTVRAANAAAAVGDTAADSQLAFVYVPTVTPGAFVGRFDGSGAIPAAFQNPDVSITPLAPGEFELIINGFTPDQGVLIITPEFVGGGGVTDDNIVTYETNGANTGWIIRTRDLDPLAAPPATEDTGTDFVASFVFLPLDLPVATETITEVDGQAISIGNPVTLSSGATVTLLADGSLEYNPNNAFEFLGTGARVEDTFEYTVVSGGLAGTGTVSVLVSGVEDSPEANEDTLLVSRNSSPLPVPVLDNDTTDQGEVVKAINIDVDQNDTGNNTTSVTVTAPQASLDFAVRDGSNRGDYNVQIGATFFTDAEEGILLTTLRQNGIDHGDGQGFQTGNSAIATTNGAAGSGGYFIPVHDATSSRAEFNSDVGAVYFAFQDGWVAGHVTAPSNNAPFTNINASTGLVLNPGSGEFGLTDNTDGTSVLTLPGVDSRTDGILLVNHGKNEGNWALQQALGDGSGWNIYVRDNSNAFGVNQTEADPLAWVYVPNNSKGIVSGKFRGDGSTVTAFDTGEFTLAKTGTGTYRLRIPGQSPTTGVLLLSPEAENGTTSVNYDNHYTYEPANDGTDDFIITSNDILNGGVPSTALEDVGTELAASFAFLPFEVRETPVIKEINGTAVDLDPNTSAPDTVTTANGGTVTLTNEGTGLTYTPAADYSGPDTFTYTIMTSGGTDTATVNVTVSENSTPVAVDDTPTNIAEDSGATIIDVLANDSDPDNNDSDPDNDNVLTISQINGQPISVDGTVAVSLGRVTLEANQTLTFVPDPDAFGDVNFTYQISDSAGGFDTATVSFTITEVADDTVGGSYTAKTIEDTSVAITVLTNDFDPDLRPLSVTGNTDPGNGTVSLNDDTFTYTPNTDFFGIDTFFYTVGDGFGDEGIARVDVTVVSNGNIRTIVSGDTALASTSADATTSIDVNPLVIAESGNITVVQNDTQNNGTSVSLTIPERSPNFGLSGGNRGDYDLQIGEARFDDAANGMLISQVRANTVDHGQGQGIQTGTSFVEFGGGSYFIPVSQSGSGGEFNTNIAASYFPFEAGWITGNVNSSSLRGATPGLTFGQEVSQVSSGIYTLDLRTLGIDSQTDGVVIVIGGKNEDNYGLVQANADGTWTMSLKDNGQDGPGSENDPVSFVYVPNGTTGVVSGKFDGDGTATFSNGTFTVTEEGSGVYRLSIPGISPTDGALLLSPENGGTNNVDNFVTYQADGNDFLINHWDITGSGAPVLEDVATELVASFAFIPFQVSGVAPTITEIDGTLAGVGTPITLASGATATLESNGTITYNPNGAFDFLAANEEAIDTFTYTTSDGVVTTTVVVTGVNDAPVANDDSGIIITEGATNVTIDVLANDTDDEFTVAPAISLDIVENDTGNNPTSVTVTAIGASPNVSVAPDSNRGDFNIQLGASAAGDYDDAILITQVSDNDNGLSATSFTGTSFVEVTGTGSYFIPVSPSGAGGEFNTDVVAAYFEFTDGWLAGRTSILGNGNTDRLEASAGLVLNPNVGGGQSGLTDDGGGLFTLDLTNLGINSQSDGILIAIGGKNEDNFASNSANANGTWTIRNKDNGDNDTGNEEDPVAFVFIPDTTANVVSGRFDGNASKATDVGTGESTVTEEGTGIYRLSIPGFTPNDGVLLLSPDSGGSSSGNFDNFVTYQPDGDDFLINHWDITGGGAPVLEDVGAEQVASFVFIPFTVPETAGRAITRINETAITEGTPFTLPSGATVTVLTGGANLTYSPPSSTFTGQDSFTYTVLAADGLSSTATVSLNVVANDPPDAVDDTPAAINEDNGPLNIDVLANDTDPNPGNVLSITEINGQAATVGTPINVTNGEVTLEADGTITYLANANFFGIETFTYTISDGFGGTDAATVTVTLNEVQDDTIGVDDTAKTVEDNPVVIDVIGNDIDPDNRPLTVSNPSDPANGTLTVNADNTITYTPDAGFFGIDTFTYTVGDAFGANATATVTVSVLSDGNVEVIVSGDQFFAATTEDATVSINPARTVIAEAGNIAVVQNDTGNEGTSVSLSVPEGSPNFGLSGGNRGDYDVRIGTLRGDDAANGMLISQVRANTVDHGQGQGTQVGTSFVAFGGGGYFIPVSPSPAGGEFNTNVAAAYFPFEAGWITGNVDSNSVQGATPGLTFGQEVSQASSGVYTLDLTGLGISSQTDGVVIVIGGKNEDNYGLVRANADGTWTMSLKDNGQNGPGSENDPVSFVYVPNGTRGVVSGKFDGTGTTTFTNGTFSLTKEVSEAGTYRLSIPGQSPTTGVLLLSPENGGTDNVDNFVTYQADGDDFIIQTRDIPDGLEDLGTELVASFAFIPFEVTLGSGSPTITEINGMTPTVGTPINLPSGAQVTLQADGTMAYNPNGAFDALITGRETVDTFTYQVQFNGRTITNAASVTITGTSDVDAGDDTATVTSGTGATVLNVLGNDSSPDRDLVAEAANISVVQNDTGNSSTSVTVTTAQSTPNFFIGATSDRGDYGVQIGAVASEDSTEGILISALRRNIVDNGEGTQTGTAAVEVRGDGSYFIPIQQAPSGSEFNSDVAAAYFEFADGWLAGHAFVSGNGSAISHINASPGINLGTEFVDNGGGNFTLDLTGQGINSQTDGVLIAIGGKNEDNFGSHQANADGTWTIRNKDNGDDADGNEQDPVAFVYIPNDTPNVVSGKFDGNANQVPGVGAGSYTLTEVSTGVYRLSISGFSPEDGVLLVSPDSSGADAGNFDNFVTYEADGDDFLINHWDTNGSATLEDVDSELVGSFVFIPFQAPSTPTITAVTQGDNGGTVTISPDGTSVSYEPAGSFTGTERFTYTISDGRGGTDTAEVVVTVNANTNPLQVQTFTPTQSGFNVTFNRSFDTTTLNLYNDVESQTLDIPDIDLFFDVGNDQDPTNDFRLFGTVVVDANGNNLQFVASRDALLPGTYHVRLRSGDNAFRDTSATQGQLDGNGDGTRGDDYTTSFTVSSTDRVISIPDFVRGPGQPVNLPATATGLPLTITEGENVTEISFTLGYDSSFLNITGADLGADAPAGSNVTLGGSPGAIEITFTSPTALPAGLVNFVNLIADVPDDAGYRGKQVLDIENLIVEDANDNPIAARDDDGVHISAYIGDVTGNLRYSSLDASRVAQVVVQTSDANANPLGFAAFQNADPILLGDVTQNSRLSSLDASWVVQKAVGLTRPEIPDLPGLTTPPPLAGPDPRLFVGTATADAGTSVTVDIGLEVPSSEEFRDLNSLSLVIFYDPTALTISAQDIVGVEDLFDAGVIAMVDPTAGVIVVSINASGTQRIQGGTIGTLARMTFSIAQDASGTTLLNVVPINTYEPNRQERQYTEIDEDQGTSLYPKPTAAADDEGVDGYIQIVAAAPVAGRPSSAKPLSSSLWDQRGDLYSTGWVPSSQDSFLGGLPFGSWFAGSRSPLTRDQGQPTVTAPSSSETKPSRDAVTVVNFRSSLKAEQPAQDSQPPVFSQHVFGVFFPGSFDFLRPFGGIR